MRWVAPPPAAPNDTQLAVSTELGAAPEMVPVGDDNNPEAGTQTVSTGDDLALWAGPEMVPSGTKLDPVSDKLSLGAGTEPMAAGGIVSSLGGGGCCVCWCFK